MNVLSMLVVASEDYGIDSQGNVTTHHWILPETSEVIWGGVASVIVFYLLYRFAWPQMKAGLAARSARIEKEYNDAKSDKSTAAQEAAQIRQAKGDIEAERARILADADVQAAAVVAEGRARIEAELIEVQAKANSEIASANSRLTDELRAEISRLSVAAVDHVVTGSLDDATQQELIESFIARVGAAR